MKKILAWLYITMLTILLTACGSKFDGRRTGNDSEFILEYNLLNKTDSQKLELQSGDIINAQIVVDGGTLAIKIQKSNEESIYESTGIVTSDSFDIAISESGIYKITVTGRNAKGSASFVVKSTE